MYVYMYCCLQPKHINFKYIKHIILKMLFPRTEKTTQFYGYTSIYIVFIVPIQEIFFRLKTTPIGTFV